MIVRIVSHPRTSIKGRGVANRSWALAVAFGVLAGAGAGLPARADVTVTRNLGASGSGTYFEGGTFSSWALGALPAGSFLKKVVINATLESSNNGNWANELTVLVDPTPGTPGGDFALQIGGGYSVFSATTSVLWAGGSGGPVSAVSDTRTAPTDFPATLDLSTAGLFLGNDYGGPGIGGTWSGTISVTYAAPIKIAAGFSNLSLSKTLSSGTPSVTLGGTVSGSGPVYPANGELVHVTINGVPQNATISGGAGAFILTFPTSSIPASATPYPITYTYDGNATNLLGAVDTSTTLTMSSKIVPIITAWPTASNITYGQTLSASTLSGGSASVAGSFSFTVPSTKPTTVGPCVASGTFTPTNAATYASVVVAGVFTIGVGPQALTLASAAVTPKTYDGTAAAALTGALTGVVAGDEGAVSLVGNGIFASARVGTGIAVTATCSLSGAQAGNYTLTQPAGLTGNITRAVLTVTADNLGSLVGMAIPPLTYTLSGFQQGETATTAGVTGVPALVTAATSASPEGTYPITCTVNTLAAPNYSFTAVNGNLSIINSTLWAAGTGTWDINATANWKTPGGAAIVYANDMSVIFDDSAAGTGPFTVTLNTIVLPTRVAVNNSTKNYTISGSGQISGNAGLTKAGSGMLTLSNTNTYTGKTVINGGTLAFYGDGSLGAVPAAPQADNITLNNGGTLRETPGPQNTTLNANRGITLGSGVQTIRHNGYGWLLINGVISGPGGLDVTSDDGNDLRFGGTNTYTGDTRLFSNLGIMYNARCLEGTTLDYNNYGGQLNYLTIRGFTAVTFGGLKGAQNLAIGSVAISIGNNNSDTTYSGALSGTGSLTKIGTGTLTLSGNNTYTGTTNVNAGTLLLNGANTGTTTLTVAGTGRLGGNGSSSAAVTVQTGGKLLVDISNWTGAGGSGFSDLNVASLDLTGATWTLNVSSATSFANFSETSKSFPFLITSGGISGFLPAKVTVSAAGFPGSGAWSVRQNVNTLELVYTVGSSASFATWAAGLTNPPLSNTDANADPDNDGLSNAVEYVLGSDPRVANPGGPSTSATGTNLIFTFNRKHSSMTPDVGLRVEVSADLADWTSLPGYTIGATTATSTTPGVIVNATGPDDSDIITVTIPMAPQAKKFARLNVTITH